MKNARKTEHILDLEKEEPQQQNPFAPILNKEAIEQASATSLSLKGRTVSEMLPELSKIARELNLNLNIGKEWRLCVDELDRRNLNK